MNFIFISLTTRNPLNIQDEFNVQADVNKQNQQVDPNISKIMSGLQQSIDTLSMTLNVICRSLTKNSLYPEGDRKSVV